MISGINLIETKIRSFLKNIFYLSIIDESDKHSDHFFSLSLLIPSHISLILVSDDFVGMSLLNRHRLIFRLLKNEIEKIHGISLNLYTKIEFNKS